MFSKPILVAGIIATVQSTAIIAPKGILPLGSAPGTVLIASSYSCMDCLRLPTDLTGWVYIKTTNGAVSFQKDVWEYKIRTMVKKLPITNVQFGEGTCAGFTSTGSGAGALANVGAALYSDASTLTTATYGRIVVPTSGVWNVLAMVAQCPAYNLVCGAKPTVTAT